MNDLFRTVVPVKKHPFPISHKSKIIMLGSCFSENISNRLDSFHFNIFCNPTGIIYNPLSISDVIGLIISGKEYRKDDLFFHDDLWHSFDHHSRFSRQTIECALNDINSNIYTAHQFLQNADYLILTPGSSFTYRYKETGKVVANCHRLPHHFFERQCESVDTIYNNWNNLFQNIFSKYPKINIILTISPVRHYPSEPVDNQVSKANCISAIYALEKAFENVYYFPSYEIMMDELRDYRFYEQNMTHPNNTAIDYIWKRFYEGCVCDRSIQFIIDFTAIHNAHNHRISKDQVNNSRFALSIINKINNLILKYPEINLQKDLTYFQSLIS